MYNPVWLQSFIVVAESQSFTAAAERLNLRQSTISDHIRKLEAACSRRLFVRDTHNIAITIDGEAMLGFARSILSVTERAKRHFAEEVRGRVRFGVSEDIVLRSLPDALRRFTALHPGIELELTVGLSETVRDKLKDGDLDLVFLKRRPGERHGDLVLRDPLSWIVAPAFRFDPEKPVPLIVLAPPSLTRLAAFAALEAQGRPWRIACSSGSQSGVHAAARAGLGVAPHARSLIPVDLVEAPSEMRLPALGDTEFVILMGRGSRAASVRALADMILGGGWLVPGKIS